MRATPTPSCSDSAGTRFERGLRAARSLLSDLTLTRRAFLNVLAAGLDYFVRIAVMFAITPLLVAGLGDFVFGAWRILGSLTGYLSAASGRPTQALKWTLAKLQSSTDYAEKRAQVGSALLVWLLFSPLLLLLGGVCVLYLPTWLDAPPELWPVLRLATAILAVNMTLISLAEVPRSILDGENLGFRRMGLSAGLSLLNGGFVVLALHWEAGLAGVATATLTTTVLTGMLFLRVTRVHVPWLGVARPSRAALRRFFDLSGWFLAWRLLTSWMLAADILLLGMLSSVELVTSYSLAKYVPEALVNVVGLTVFGVLPGLGRIIGAGDVQRAARVRGEVLAFTWLLTTTCGALLMLWNEAFVRLWVGASYFPGATENALLVLMIVQFIFIRIDANVIDLSLDLRTKVLLGLLSAVLATGLAIASMRILELGIVGLCLGFMAGRSILSVAYPLLVSRLLGLSPWAQLLGATRAAAVSAGLFVVAAGADDFVDGGSWLPIESWPGLAVATLASFGAVSCACFFLGLTARQRRMLLDRARGLVAI
jgi:O-antigen/teichoic acid export membrane protein